MICNKIFFLKIDYFFILPWRCHKNLALNGYLAVPAFHYTCGVMERATLSSSMLYHTGVLELVILYLFGTPPLPPQRPYNRHPLVFLTQTPEFRRRLRYAKGWLSPTGAPAGMHTSNESINSDPQSFINCDIGDALIVCNITGLPLRRVMPGLPVFCARHGLDLPEMW